MGGLIMTNFSNDEFNLTAEEIQLIKAYRQMEEPFQAIVLKTAIGTAGRHPRKQHRTPKLRLISLGGMKS
jgi:hypothetical protein